MNIDMRAIRLYNGLSQRAMAQKLGISASYLCDIEAGRKRVTRDLRMRVAMMFDVTDEMLEAIRRAKASDKLVTT